MKWYKIENKGEKAEIWIYEEIGEDFWTGGGVTAKSFQKELSAIKANQIDLHINSPGGVVFDGITIYNLIKAHPAKVTTYIDGLAASIASVIALAGNRIVMAENALYMVHNPSGMAWGTSEELRATADVLDKVRDSILQAYTDKTGRPEDEIKAMLDAETWMNAEEAKAAGFIDEVAGEMDMAACIGFIPKMAKMGFKRIPDDIAASKQMPTARSLERVLRDAGCSAKQAKAILSKGYSDEFRDEAETEAPGVQRDVAPIKIDRVADLLVRAEIVAPSA